MVQNYQRKTSLQKETPLIKFITYINGVNYLTTSLVLHSVFMVISHEVPIFTASPHNSYSVHEKWLTPLGKITLILSGILLK